MKIQVLVATVNQEDYSLLDKMNIDSDVIVGNQCDKNVVDEFDYKGWKVKWLSFKERGVGLNRNNVLMRADGDICIIADDDIVFKEGYRQNVCDTFNDYPKADVIICNIDEEIGKYNNQTEKVKKINKRNYGSFGAERIAFRLNSIKFQGISFNQMFGGGAQYSCGEDTLFIKSCLDKGLKIIAVPEALANLEKEPTRQSTWFSGYNDKYFFDKGVLYYLLNKKLCKLTALYHCFKHRNTYKEYGFRNAFRTMLKGIKSAKSNGR